MERTTSVALALALAVTGCAGFNKSARQAAGMGVVEDRVASFDGTRVISLSPTPVAGTDGTFSTCCHVGLSWSPSAPGAVTLRAELTAIAGIRSVSLNLDGVITDLPPTGRQTQFTGDDHSFKTYTLRRTDLEGIVTARQAKLLITTHSDGSVVGDLLRTDGAMLIDFLPDFLRSVEGAARTVP
jgi:hypothetical protein